MPNTWHGAQAKDQRTHDGKEAPETLPRHTERHQTQDTERSGKTQQKPQKHMSDGEKGHLTKTKSI